MTSAPYACPICGKGNLIARVDDYIARLPDGESLVVKNVPMDVCNSCGEIALGEDAAQLIDSAIEEYTEALTTKELEDIRNGFHVNQSQMSEILGLGGKTYHRWEKGSQLPSRSMGFYLRLLQRFPDIFDWLKERKWRSAPVNRIGATADDVVILYPSLNARGCNAAQINSSCARNSNAARVLFCINK